jgi:hypothetical protein
LRFIIVNPMVPELRTLIFSTIGPMHATVFRDFFFYTVLYRNLKLSMSCSELSYISSSPFIIVTSMVQKVCALRFFLLWTYACNNIPVLFFFYTISYRNLELSTRFFKVKLRIEFAFHHRDHYGSRVKCPSIFYYRTYICI